MSPTLPKLVLVSAAAATLVLGSSAVLAKPGKQHYEGAVNLEPDSRVSFVVVKKEKKFGKGKRRGRRKVKNVVLEQALAGCGGGSIAPIDASIPGTAKVRKKKRKFKLRASGPDHSFTFKGKITNRGRIAYGDFHLIGTFDVDGVPRACDTGPRGWEADRTRNTR